MAASDPSLDASIVVVGDEILDGFIEDTNAGWLTRRLHGLGIPVRAVAIVRDQTRDIRAAVEHALRSRPTVVITTGGIGGTWDDVTYEAVATCLGRECSLTPRLAKPVRSIIDWAATQGYEFDEDAEKGMMRIATVPAGAEVLQLDTFLACVRVDVEGGIDRPGGATILMLPGPPGHLQALFDRLVGPQLLADRGTPLTVREVEHDYPETLLVGVFGRIRNRFPEVSLGSYPGDPMVVRFQGTPAVVDDAVEELEHELRRLDQHPASEVIKEAWQRQVVEWGA